MNLEAQLGAGERALGCLCGHGASLQPALGHSCYRTPQTLGTWLAAPPSPPGPSKWGTALGQPQECP